MTKKINITQEQMADFMGESQQYISLLINNKIIPRLPKIKKFSKRTKTDLSFWLTATGPKKEQAIITAIVSQLEGTETINA